MDFTLTHEQQMIQQMAREFAQQELLPGVLERDEKSEFPLEQFRKFGQTGMFGTPMARKSAVWPAHIPAIFWLWRKSPR